MAISSGLQIHFLFSFWPRLMRDLSPSPGTDPVPSALEGESLNHWTTREVPIFCILTLHTWVTYVRLFLENKTEFLWSHISTVQKNVALISELQVPVWIAGFEQRQVDRVVTADLAYKPPSFQPHISWTCVFTSDPHAPWSPCRQQMHRHSERSSEIVHVTQPCQGQNKNSMYGSLQLNSCTPRYLTVRHLQISHSQFNTILIFTALSKFPGLFSLKSGNVACLIVDFYNVFAAKSRLEEHLSFSCQPDGSVLPAQQLSGSVRLGPISLTPQVAIDALSAVKTTRGQDQTRILRVRS